MTARVKVLYIFSIWLSTLTGHLYGQASSDIYLFSLQQTPDGVNHVYSPKFLTYFNQGGFTYQPGFTPQGDILVSARKAGEKQFDLYQLLLTQKKIRRLTHTAASEFLPAISSDGHFLSFIHKELNTDPALSVNDQQVMRVDTRTQKMETVTKDIHDVAAYAWMSPHQLGIRRLDNALVYLETNESKAQRITTSIGNTILADKNGRLIYVHKFDQDYYYLKKFNPSSSQIDVISVTPQKAEELAISPDGTYFMSKDHTLYSLNPAQSAEWKQVADLSLYGIKYITGLCVSPDGHQMAIVATKEKP